MNDYRYYRYYLKADSCRYYCNCNCSAVQADQAVQWENLRSGHSGIASTERRCTALCLALCDLHAGGRSSDLDSLLSLLISLCICQSLPVVVGSMCIEIQGHVTAIHSIHNHLIHDEVSIHNLGICNKIGFLLSHGTVAFFGTTTAKMHNIMIYHNALNIFEHLCTSWNLPDPRCGRRGRMTENDADFFATLSWGVPPGSTEEPLSLHRPWAALPCTCTQRPGRHRTQNSELSELRLHQIPNIPIYSNGSSELLLSDCTIICFRLSTSFRLRSCLFAGTKFTKSHWRVLKGHEGPWRAQMIQTSPSGFPDDLVNPLIPVPLESELWQERSGEPVEQSKSAMPCAEFVPSF